MTVHVFGTVSSSASCLYALRRTADDNREDFSDVHQCVKENFYVDDLLDSVKTEEEAQHRVTRLTELLKKGGFHLTKWMSSSRRVLSSIPACETTTSQLDLERDELPVERALGLTWDAERDQFLFKVCEAGESTAKREILSYIAAQFDPLGFLAPVILIAKGIMQDVWRHEISWDGALPGKILTAWREWSQSLTAVRDLRIP